MLLRKLFFIFFLIFASNLFASNNYIQEMIDCHDSYGCVEKEILGEDTSNNIVDLLTIAFDRGFWNDMFGVDKESHDKVTNANIADLRTIANKPISDITGEEHLLLQLRVLYFLARCLKENIGQDKLPTSQFILFGDIPNVKNHFLYGEQSNDSEVKTKARLHYAQCVIRNNSSFENYLCEDKVDESIPDNLLTKIKNHCEVDIEEDRKNKKFTEDYSSFHETVEEYCTHVGGRDYFEKNLPREIEQFVKRYGQKEEVEKATEVFLKCIENFDSAYKANGCFEDLNLSLLKLKGPFYVQKTKEALSLDKVPEKVLTDFHDCLEQKTESYGSCRTKLIFNSIGDKKLNFEYLINGEVNKRCRKNTSLYSGTDCIDDIKFADQELDATATDARSKYFLRELEQLMGEENDILGISKPTINIDINMYSQIDIDDVLDEGDDENLLLRKANVSINEIVCIQNYTGSGYMHMNPYFWRTMTDYSDRDQRYPKTKCTAQTLRKLAKISTKENDLYYEELRRGMGETPFAHRFNNQDDCILFTGMTSTSTDDGFDGKYMLKIKNCLEGTPSTGVWISQFSFYEHEDEVLFPPGVRFKVTSTAKKREDVEGDIYDVELECVTQEQAEKEKLSCY